MDPAEACLLGSPVGGQPCIEGILSSKREALELLSHERLSLLHSHDRYSLLVEDCFKFALVKVLYVLRTTPCFESPLLLDFDCGVLVTGI